MVIKMKRVLSFLMSVIMVVGVFGRIPTQAKAEKIITSSDNDFKYVLNSDGGATIVECLTSPRKLIIPDEIDNYKVTRIRKVGNCKPKVLQIGKNVRVINRDKGLDSVKKLVAVNSNTYFSTVSGVLFNKQGTRLVYYPRSKSATKYIVPKTVRVIGDGAFGAAKNLKKVVFYDRLKKIDDYAFAGCEKLRAAVIPKSVTYIGICAYWQCRKLSKLSVGGNKRLIIGFWAFESCKSLKSLRMPLMSEKCTGGVFERSGIKKVTIPQNVSAIPKEFFIGCNRLNSITVPSTVKRIGEKALGYIWGDYEVEKNKNFVIKGTKGSAAEKYAEANKIKFRSI